MTASRMNQLVREYPLRMVTMCNNWFSFHEIMKLSFKIKAFFPPALDVHTKFTSKNKFWTCSYCFSFPLLGDKIGSSHYANLVDITSVDYQRMDQCMAYWSGTRSPSLPRKVRGADRCEGAFPPPKGPRRIAERLPHKCAGDQRKYFARSQRGAD